jgi:hypothetical protein
LSRGWFVFGAGLFLVGCLPPPEKPFNGSPVFKTLACRSIPGYSCLAVRDSGGREFQAAGYRYLPQAVCESIFVPVQGKVLVQKVTVTTISYEPLRPAAAAWQASGEIADLAVDPAGPRPVFFLLDRTGLKIHRLDHLFQYVNSMPLAISYPEKISVMGNIVAVLGRYEIYLAAWGDQYSVPRTVTLPLGCRGLDLAWDNWSRLWVMTSCSMLRYNRDGDLLENLIDLPGTAGFVSDPRIIHSSPGGEIWIWDGTKKSLLHLNTTENSVEALSLDAGISPLGFFPIRNGFCLWDAKQRLYPYDLKGEPYGPPVTMPGVSALEAVDANHFLGWRPGSPQFYRFTLEQKREEKVMPYPKPP